MGDANDNDLRFNNESTVNGIVNAFCFQGPSRTELTGPQLKCNSTYLSTVQVGLLSPNSLSPSGTALTYSSP